MTSVSAQSLSIPYLAVQLRVYHGELLKQGIEADRVLLFLRSDAYLRPGRMKIVAAAAFSPDLVDQMDAQLSNLATSEPGVRHFRYLVVPSIELLHESALP